MSTSPYSRILKNVFGAGATRIVSLALSLGSVPLLLHLLGKEQYGTWVTLTSVLTWVSLFDFGVGNSLRNTAAGLGLDKTADDVFAETFGLFKFVMLIAVSGVLVFLLVGPSYRLMSEHWSTVCLLYPVYLLFFPFTLGGNVLQGLGKVALQSAVQALPGILFVLALGVLYLLSAQPSLPLLAFLFASPFAVVSLYLFGTALRRVDGQGLGASLHWLRAPIPLDRVRMGLKFLTIQVSGLVLYNLGNLINYNMLGPAEVARFDVINRAFQVALSFYLIVISVVWAEASRLIAAKALTELRQMHKRLLLTAGAFATVVILFAFVAPFFIGLWTGRAVQVSVLEVLACATMVSVQAIAYAGGVFLNAFERVRLQAALAVLAAVLIIPVSRLLIGLGWGIAAVPSACALLMFLPMIIWNAHVYRLLKSF